MLLVALGLVLTLSPGGAEAIGSEQLNLFGPAD